MRRWPASGAGRGCWRAAHLIDVPDHVLHIAPDAFEAEKLEIVEELVAINLRQAWGLAS